MYCKTLSCIALLILWSSIGEAQTVRRLGKASCAECIIRVTLGVKLGDLDGAGVIGRPVSVTQAANQDYFLSYLESSAEILRFASGGAHALTFGRSGEGPGEYRFIRHLLAREDSLLVFDNSLGRITVLDPELNVQRTFTFPSDPLDLALVGDTLLAINAIVLSRDLVGYPVHVVDLTGEQRQSIGYNGGALRLDVPGFGVRRVADAGDGTILIAFRDQYRIERWSLAGELLDVFVRDAPFFLPHNERHVPTPDRPPPPFLIDLVADAQGRIRTLVAVPDEEWREAVARHGSTGYEVLDDNAYYDTVIEIIDPSTGSLIASTRVDQYAQAFLSPDEFYSYSDSEEAYPRVTTWRVTVNPPQPRSLP